ncbi:MAG: DUF4013 domain-containing protein [Chloroflexaceae bacterium]|nr:DUF4013 domain-containing protein [Chloroflexaceae bacterium]
MNNPVNIDIGEAFGFAFKDDKWIVKILVGGLLLFVPIIGTFMASGYTAATARHVVDRHPSPLPEWDNFGDLLKRGFFYLVIGLVYALPILLPMFLFLCVLFPLGAAAGDSDTAAGAGLIGLMTLCLIPLVLIFTIVASLFSYAALVRYVQSDKLGDAFQFGGVIEMVRAQPMTWVMLLLVGFLCGLVAGSGSLLFGFGFLFTTIYAQAVFGHALGQVAAQLSTAGAHDFGQNQFDPSM